ncbi:MAG: response regulator [Paludibacteraceae bacterium]|nr:response regulator [Paludibacteraceae bacterium]
MKKFLSFCIVLAWAATMRADLVCQHYSVEDGLSQNTVMSIIQDHKGFMWFGTWDGLNKFDGYQFTVYKSRPGDNNTMTNNRVDFLYEDALNYIWFQTYDNRLHRFDTKTETFYSLPYNTRKLVNNIANRRHFVEVAPGDIWIDAVDSVIHVWGETPNSKSYRLKATVNFIAADLDGSVWIGTEKGLYEANGCDIKEVGELQGYDVTSIDVINNTVWFSTYEGFLFRKTYDKIGFEKYTIEAQAHIIDVGIIESRYIIATTSNDGVYVYDYVEHRLEKYNTENTTDIKSNSFSTIVIDSYDMVWLENDQNGIFLYNPKTHFLTHLESKPDPHYAHNLGSNLIVLEDAAGRVWVNPQGGGWAYYNREIGELVSIEGVSNVIHAAFFDKSGSMWLSTYAKGIDRLTHVKSQFSFINLDDEVRALYQTDDGYVIAGTKDGRTHLFDGIVELGETQQEELVYCVLQDADNRIWLGTRGNGILVYDHMNGNLIKHYKHNPQDPYSLSSNEIYDIVQDNDRNIYIGTYGGGLNILEYGKDTFVSMFNSLPDYPADHCSKIRTLMLDSMGILWIGTTNGLLRMNTVLRQFKYSQKEVGNPQSLSNNDVHSILEDSNGQVWIGTFGGGLNKVLNDKWDNDKLIFESYTTQNGLVSDIVLSIQEDNSHKLWFSSENSLTRFDKDTKVSQSFNVFKGGSDMFFTESNALLLATGEMLFGCNNGICVFNPDRILPSDEVPQIEFTRFQLFNSDVVVGAEDSPLKKGISESDEIVLEHDQSVFSIEYAALNYADEQINYAFILDGFEKKWNYVGTQRKATYTNLPQGTYTFRVRSTNAEGIWVNNEHTLKVIVKPSFWQTPWAILIYLILFVLILYGVFMLIKHYNGLRQNVEIEQKVTDIKLRFFTNISHELRTPLTLIAGPVENILTNEYISPSVRNQLEIVKSNSNRMLRLINQILDFRKIQNKKLRLKIQKTNIDELVRQTCANFNKEAFDKHITFNVQTNIEDKELWVDKDKTDIILYNLLSNAFKFTPSGKSIVVTLDEKPGYVMLSVADEGIGIEKNKLSALFERFTSNNEINAGFNIVGTGIGLNLVKELVDLHHGFIDVKSEVGEGSTFTVMFRRGHDHFGEDVDYIVDDTVSDKDAESKVVGTARVVENVDNPTLLVVEDNDDMGKFLADILSANYNIVIAKDGQEGIDKAKELSPVLIISDLMMPNKDGLALVQELKQDINTSHIPIILLTAKTAIESKLEALKYGADDYITKPFSPVYLVVRVENILEQRKRLQQNYRQNLVNLNPEKVDQASPDEIFLAKLMTIMDKNIDNSELTVDGLLSEMAMGRTVFYNKLKGLTGFSPVEFIREVRIKRAAQLLETGQYSVTEITYMVGMNDARYFSKCFKAVFGVTPSEYKRNMSK